MKLPRRIVLLLALLALCPALAEAGTVRLSAAASLKEVLNDLSAGYAVKHPGVSFVKNFGASGTLAKQLESGAQADLFISANTQWMNYLKDRKQVASATVTDFTYNTLVFAGVPGTRASAMSDLVKLDRIAIGSPKSVPAGEYAMEAFKAAGIAAQLGGKLVMAKDVRESLMYAERGEVDGAVVYYTDALEAKRVRVLFAVPQKLYPRIVYPLALTQAGAGNREAGDFYRYLLGPEARAVLAKHGFGAR